MTASLEHTKEMLFHLKAARHHLNLVSQEELPARLIKVYGASQHDLLQLQLGIEQYMGDKYGAQKKAEVEQKHSVAGSD